jgi:hypothetical protein
MTEVLDVTTGRPIRAVPDGAVSMDSAAQIAFLEQGLYRPQRSLYSTADLGPLSRRSIANVVQNPEPIKGLGALPALTTKNVVIVAAVGVAIGALAGYFSKKKRSS